MDKSLAGEDPLILSALNDYLYCPRRCALHRVEGVWQANAFTVASDIAHRKVDDSGYRQTLDAAGGKVRLERAVPLYSYSLNLIGKADMVEFHTDPAGGAAVPLPVEFKMGRRHRWDNNEVQLCAQGLCLEEMLGVAVPKGAIFHVKSHRRQEVLFLDDLRRLTHETIRACWEMIRSGQTPPGEPKPQCRNCSVRSVCLPELTRSAGSLGALAARLYEVDHDDDIR